MVCMGKEIVVTAKVDKLRANCKAVKELQIGKNINPN